MHVPVRGLVLSFLLALLAAASAGAAVPRVSGLAVTPSVSSAVVHWTTATPSRGRVAYGVGGLYLYSAPEPAPTTAHQVALSDLLPGTTYEIEVESGGVTAPGTVTTQLRSGTPRFGIDGTHVTADGSLFFPVLSYEQCAQTIGRALALGVNMFVQVPYTGCADPAGVTPPYVLSDDYTGSAGAGWYLPDEPDGWGVPPEQLPQLQPAAATGRLRVLNLSQHFFSDQAIIRSGYDRSTYMRYAALADVVGFDMYPIVKFCGRVPLLEVYRAQRELMTTYAPGKPTFQWIETSQMTGECPTMQITPAIVNAETWLAVAGGACGIGYFTNSWTGPVWNRWDFDQGVEAQIGATVARLQGLAPALCATTGQVVVPWDGTVAATSRSLNGAVYVIAVNSSPDPTTIPFRVEGLSGRPLLVLDENRTLQPVKKIYFRDHFGPYEVHVYVAAPT